MRATIVAEDNLVIVDGIGRYVDLSSLRAQNQHALQWYDTYGEVEYTGSFDNERKIRVRQTNKFIDDLSPYQGYLDAWHVENEKQLALEEEQRQEAAKQQAEAEAYKERIRAYEASLPQVEAEKKAAEEKAAKRLDDIESKLNKLLSQSRT